MKNSTDYAGLYVHVPFCKTKCPYCGFASSVNLERIPAWRAGIEKEAALVQDRFGLFDTLYIGGGTPTVLDEEALAAILTFLRRRFSTASDTEITIEANPGDLSAERISGLLELGVDRVSVGVQSFDDRELAFLQRRHTAREASEALSRIRATGFVALGVDLIYGLRGQTLGDWNATLRRALEFEPEHLSCYQLTIEENTPFHERQGRESPLVASEDEQASFFLATSELLESRGYVHYEISNFALGERQRSRHNQKYWHHTPYLGLGPAAHSFNEGKRWWNHRSIEAYLEALEAGAEPRAGFEHLTPEQLRLEAIMLGLRTRDGVKLSTLRATPDFERCLQKLQEEGLASVCDDRLKASRRGFLVADRLALLFR